MPAGETIRDRSTSLATAGYPSLSFYDEDPEAGEVGTFHDSVSGKLPGKRRMGGADFQAPELGSVPFVAGALAIGAIGFLALSRKSFHPVLAS